MPRTMKKNLTDSEVEYVVELEKEYHAKLHSAGLCRCPTFPGVGLSKAVPEADPETVFWAQFLQKLDMLLNKIQKVYQTAKEFGLPLQAAKAAVSANTRDRIAAEVKKTLDKMLHPGSGQPREGEPGSTVDLVKKALDEAGWEGVETLARTRRYIG